MALLELQELLVHRDQKDSRVILDQLVHKDLLVILGQRVQLEAVVK